MEPEVLQRLLRLAAGHGTGDSATLARELGVGPGLVRQMLDELARLGYIEAVVPGCSKPCEACPLQAMCLYRRQPRIWIVTARGERFLQKPRRTD